MRSAALGGKRDGIVLGHDDALTDRNRGSIPSYSRTNKDVRVTR
jgi:hypothetical protein